jgi:hypothetical protein
MEGPGARELGPLSQRDVTIDEEFFAQLAHDVETNSKPRALVKLGRMQRTLDNVHSRESVRLSRRRLPSLLILAVSEQADIEILTALVEAVDYVFDVDGGDVLKVRRINAISYALSEAIKHPTTLNSHLRLLLNALMKDVTRLGDGLWNVFAETVDQTVQHITSFNLRFGEAHDPVANDRHRCNALAEVVSAVSTSEITLAALSRVNFRDAIRVAEAVSSDSFRGVLNAMQTVLNLPRQQSRIFIEPLSRMPRLR